eukprot:1185164-Prorocentrum_minimum.AAC.1
MEGELRYVCKASRACRLGSFVCMQGRGHYNTCGGSTCMRVQAAEHASHTIGHHAGYMPPCLTRLPPALLAAGLQGER